MAKSGNISELRADGSDLGPPVVVSGAANSPTQVTDPQPRCYGPPASYRARRRTVDEANYEATISALRYELLSTRSKLGYAESDRDLLLRVVLEQKPSSALTSTTPGIYFLYKNNSLVYVGQSRDIARRIARHRKTTDFNDFRFVEWPNEHTRAWRESDLIRLLRPRLNKAELVHLQDRHAKLTVTM